jgi:hypothetical protein
MELIGYGILLIYVACAIGHFAAMIHGWVLIVRIGRRFLDRAPAPDTARPEGELIAQPEVRRD